MILKKEIKNILAEDNSDEDTMDDEVYGEAETHEDDHDEEQHDSEENGDELEDDEDEIPPIKTPKPAPKPGPDAGAPKPKKNETKNTTIAVQKPSTTAKLVIEAIKHLNERQGSSIVAIKRVIISNNPDLEEKRLLIQIKRFVKNSLANGSIVQIKRSFKISKKYEEEQNKLKKNRKKAQKEKQKEKSKEKKKEVKKANPEKGKNKQKDEKMKKKSGDKEKSAKPSKQRPAASKAAAKTTKMTKSDEKESKGPTTKPKLKVRKSINLVVNPTHPRSKTFRKTKPAPTGMINGDSKSESPAASALKTAETNGSSVKNKRTKKV